MKVYKNIFAIMMVMGLSVFALTGCSLSKNNSSGEVPDMVIEKFSELTQIPRPSRHEEQVSDYLKSWAEKQGFQVVQDDSRNLIIDVPAMEGMEDKPFVALQGHMDMVFAQQNGLDLDPCSTAIQMKNDGKNLTSDGRTSLGADNGIGIAIMECVAEGKMAHGPLRLIMTTNEEEGSIGVANLDPNSVRDVEYLINLDNEMEGQMVISSASAIIFEYSRALTPDTPRGDMDITLSFDKLTGGHSGLDIDKGKMNGIMAMGEVLHNLKKNQISFELKSISGGAAPNAIPVNARAVLCIAEDDYQKCYDCCNETVNDLKTGYSKTEPDMVFEITETEETEKSEQVLSKADTDLILAYMDQQFDGVYTMSQIIEGLVESSSNLGVITVEPTGFSAKGMLRSSNAALEKELIEKNRALADTFQFEYTTNAGTAPWPVKEENRLQKIAEEAYRDIFSKDLGVIAVHAGLECGAFARYNSEMDIISIGPNITSPHTIQEVAEIESINKLWKFLEGILARV